MNTGTCSGGSRKRTRKMRGGNFYGFGGTVGTAGPEWNAVRNAGADSATGALKPELYDIQAGGRRRKSRKVSRRRRVRRGGQEPEEEVKEEEVEETEPEEMEGGRRRRKSKKAKKSKKSRKVSRRRKMRGGAGMLPSYPVSAGFTGSGQRGIIDVENVAVPRPNGVVPLPA